MEALTLERPSQHAATESDITLSFDVSGFWGGIYRPALLNSTVYEYIYSIPRIILDFIQKIEEFSKLPVNWDGYNAEKPSDNSLKNVRMFLMENTLSSIPYYFISPGVNGEVMVEFKNEEKTAELYFNPDGTTELFLFEGDDTLLEGNLRNNYRDLINFFNS